MPTAVTETIALEVVARLQTITTANSYNFDVASVDRPPRNGKQWRPRHRGIVVDQKPSVPNEEQSHEGNPPAMAFDITYEITGFVFLSDESTSTSDSDVSDMEFAIKESLAEDNNWHNWDGNAVNSVWGESSYIDDGDYQGVTVPLIVTYRVSETAPYTVRA